METSHCPARGTGRNGAAAHAAAALPENLVLDSAVRQMAAGLTRPSGKLTLSRAKAVKA